MNFILLRDCVDFPSSEARACSRCSSLSRDPFLQTQQGGPGRSGAQLLALKDSCTPAFRTDLSAGTLLHHGLVESLDHHKLLDMTIQDVSTGGAHRNWIVLTRVMGRTDHPTPCRSRSSFRYAFGSHGSKNPVHREGEPGPQNPNGAESPAAGFPRPASPPKPAADASLLHSSLSLSLPQATVHTSRRDAYMQRAAAERSGRDFDRFATTSRSAAERVVSAAGGVFVKQTPARMRMELTPELLAPSGRKATGEFCETFNAEHQKTGLRGRA